jgi:hypothetical protein
MYTSVKDLELYIYTESLTNNVIRDALTAAMSQVLHAFDHYLERFVIGIPLPSSNYMANFSQLSD